MTCPHCSPPKIHDVAVVLAGPDDVRRGLCGWAGMIAGSFRFDGLGIRVTRAGKLTVTWPARRGHPWVIPIEPEIFARVEAAVLKEYAAARAKAGPRATP